jgi:hypothetical protein
MIIVHTEFQENYGAHEWDGKGACPQHWVPKGGSKYVLEDKADVSQFYEYVTWADNHAAVRVHVRKVPDGFRCTVHEENHGHFGDDAIMFRFRSWVLKADSNIVDERIVFTMDIDEMVYGYDELNEWHARKNRVHVCAHTA